MSVHFNSAVIYGYDVRDIKFTGEQIEDLEDYGLEVIYDPYEDKTLYVGVILSKVSEYDTLSPVNLTSAANTATGRLRNLIYSLSSDYKKLLFPVIETLDTYHVCWCT